MAQVTVETIDRMTPTERAAIAQRETRRGRDEVDANEVIKVQVRTIIDGLKTNRLHTAFTGEQRTAIKAQNDTMLDLARLIRKLNKIEGEE